MFLLVICFVLLAGMTVILPTYLCPDLLFHFFSRTFPTTFLVLPSLLFLLALFLQAVFYSLCIHSAAPNTCTFIGGSVAGVAW